MTLSRRDAIRIGASAGAGLALAGGLSAESLGLPVRQEIMTKAIPSTGERVPVIGLGTASSFLGAARSSSARRELSNVVRLFTELGGTLIDTAPTYGRSEVVLGDIIREVGNADDIFMATKVSRVRGRGQGLAQVAQSEERLTPTDLDLIQIHNLGDWRTQLGLLRELKQEGRIRYLGITTSRKHQYEELVGILREEDWDFVQFDYAIDNRSAEEELIPIARDKGMATLINGPFGATRLFRRVAGREVPGWAAEFGATSWAQFFLKWLVGHPDITVPIPATSDVEHLRDNMGALLGRAPDEAERIRMARVIEELPGG